MEKAEHIKYKTLHRKLIGNDPFVEVGDSPEWKEFNRLSTKVGRESKKHDTLIQVEVGEWLYKGCFIQKSEHPALIGKYEVFKNDADQTHVGRCYTFTEARKLCKENECFENTVNLI